MLVSVYIALVSICHKGNISGMALELAVGVSYALIDEVAYFVCAVVVNKMQ